MDTLSYKTVSANAATTDKQWVVVDAEGQRLGRLATAVAKLIRGKHKTNFTPHVDCGDYVIVINADKVEMTGNKWADKKHIWHTGFPGGQRSITYGDLRDKDSRRLMEHSVRGMLPKNRLGRAMFKNLHVFAGSEHPHEAQKPKAINLNEFK